MEKLDIIFTLNAQINSTRTEVRLQQRIICFSVLLLLRTLLIILLTLVYIFRVRQRNKYLLR